MVMLIPEANGVMVLSHEDATLPTPAGITIDTFSSLTAGEQIPGVLGIGKSFLLSPKFILPEGGFKRVVWMSSRLKESMRDDLQAVCEREGAPDLLDKIADEHSVSTAEQLVRWLQEHDHPARHMEKMY
jgi:CO dehydrogenase/acetyl-CoA synthase beta subunit